MALGTLLQAGAERVASGVVGQLKWSEDRNGRPIRQRLTWDHRKLIQDRVSSRLGRSLTNPEKAELATIVDAADNASRRAAQLRRGDPAANKPASYTRLPGMGNKGGESYTYTTVVTTVDVGTGRERRFTVLVHSSDLLSAQDVESRVTESVGRGDVEQREGSGRAILGGIRLQSIIITSIYRGEVK